MQGDFSECVVVPRIGRGEPSVSPGLWRLDRIGEESAWRRARSGDKRWK